ncbi:MAG TPA: hydrogen peroxide-dependent heme synthase [Bacillota bacterium]
MNRAPETLEGWWLLHDFRRLDWARWKTLSPNERASAAAEAAEFFTSAAEVRDAPEGGSGLYRVLGHKADLLFLHMRPDVAHLSALEDAFARTRLADFTTRPTSYLSVIEVSLYSAREGEAEAMRANPHIQRRLRPALPAARAVCFYPMSKKREGGDNWYWEDFDRRREMMRDHGMIGRGYADRVTQMISGSTGLDDWEWGVTLFSDDPLTFKKIVYEMRFDEASARFGLFGPFYVGLRQDPSELVDWLVGR